nr:hypothetical protein [Spelaeicoccus albus]
MWVVLGLAVAALVGWPITAGILALGGRRPGAERHEHGDHAAAMPVGESVLRGGLWIGLLERLAVTACIMAGYPAGIAYVVAVKGLGRYPELRQTPAAAERFIIGSLASMLWAAAVGIAVRVLIG